MLEGPGIDSRLLAGHSREFNLQTAVTVVSNVMWTVYRAYLSGPMAHVVPEHTREACFQLFCDLRANTPKDRRFMQRHARAFMPHTTPGWLALASALGFSLSGLVALTCGTLALSVAGVWAAVGLALAAGVFLASVLSGLAFCLLLAALVSGAMASGALLLYAWAAITAACLRLASRLLLGPGPPARSGPQEEQQQQAAMLQAPEQSGVVWANGSRGTHAAGHTTASTSTSPTAQQQQQQQGAGLALPAIRTKSPRTKPGGGGSPLGPSYLSCPESPTAIAPLDSPRRLHPAAAAAAAVLHPQGPGSGSMGAPGGTSPAAAANHKLGPGPESSSSSSAKSSSTSLAPSTGTSGNGSSGNVGAAELAVTSKDKGADPAPLPRSGSSINGNGGGNTPPPSATAAPRTPSAAAAAAPAAEAAAA